jgi:isoquinoline 1-oxidoreductase subunit beta
MDLVTFQGLNPGGEESTFGYQVPNLLIDHAMRNPPITAGFWRGVNINHNTIDVECFIDELAHAAGQDPLEFRRKMLKPAHFAVLKAAADKAEYGKAPAGRYHGLAQIMGFGSYVAACVEVSVSQEGRLKIHRICAATNPGHAVTRRRSSGRSRARSSTGSRLRCTANALSPAAQSSRPISTPTMSCASTRCRKSRP